MSEAKNNHYIPQFYLSNWAFNTKNQVYCLRKENFSIFCSSTRNICADRIWDNDVESEFSKIESAKWMPVLSKIVENESISMLSNDESMKFLSFIISLISRKKPVIDEMFNAAKQVVSNFKLELFAKGLMTQKILKDIKNNEEELKKKALISVYKEQNVFNKKVVGDRAYHQLAKFTFGIINIKNNEGAFITSDYPVLLQANFNPCPTITFMAIALSPKLLVFGSRDILTFQSFNNVAVDIILERFNTAMCLNKNTEVLISNNKESLKNLIKDKKL